MEYLINILSPCSDEVQLLMQISNQSRETCVNRPFSFPVFPDLWIEGHRPGQEVDPADDLTDYCEAAAVNDQKVDPD